MRRRGRSGFRARRRSGSTAGTWTRPVPTAGPALTCRIYHLADGRHPRFRAANNSRRHSHEHRNHRDSAVVHPARSRRPRPFARRLPRRPRSSSSSPATTAPTSRLGGTADRDSAGVRRPRRPDRRDLVERRPSHPEDSFEQMELRASEQGFNFHYLYDESQESRAHSDQSGHPRCSSSTASAGSPTTGRSTTTATRRP